MPNHSTITIPHNASQPVQEPILNQDIIEQIAHLYDLIAAREYGVIAHLNQAYPHQMNEECLEEAFEEYPATFVPHPHVNESIYEIGESDERAHDHTAYSIESKAWTKEEGQSKMTLEFEAHYDQGNDDWIVTLTCIVSSPRF
jgi:hypothetical protein